MTNGESALETEIAGPFCVSDPARMNHLVFPLHPRALQRPVRDNATDLGRARRVVLGYMVVCSELVSAAVDVVESVNGEDVTLLPGAENLPGKRASADVATDDPRHEGPRANYPFQEDHFDAAMKCVFGQRG